MNEKTYGGGDRKMARIGPSTDSHVDFTGCTRSGKICTESSRPAASVQADPPWLSRLEAKVDRLLALLERPETGPRLRRDDLQILGRLLPAIAGVFGSEPFVVRDLAESDAAALALVTAGLSAKQIGRLLSRAAGVPIDGLLVERCGVEINVTLWRVLASVSNRLETGTAIARSCSIGAGEPNA